MDKKEQGKKNRAKGGAFELRVRKDLEKKGWIVSKWVNTVELHKENSEDVIGFPNGPYGKLIPAKRKYNPFNKALSIGTGWPDFIAFKRDHSDLAFRMTDTDETYEPICMVGVEAKSNGYLDKKEKEMCEWLLKNNIFSKILIAKKGKKRGEIEYVEFKML